jgi:hypothetical protein
VIAGGLGYIVRPDDRTLVATFGGGIVGVLPAPAFELLVFNDSGRAFQALGVEGWRWKTRRISWDGFKGIEIAEKTVYGLAWNEVLKYWQPFRLDIATGAVWGGAYYERSQQRIARVREMAIRGVALHPAIRRIAEAVIGLLAITLVALTLFLIVDGVRTRELTWSRVRDAWGAAYAVLFVTGVVLVLGVRLVFPSLAPGRRLLTRSGIVAFFGIYLATGVVVFLTTGAFPIPLALVFGGAIGGIAIKWWFS